MDILDITFDFETCALCPTAAVMSIGAVAWGRDFENTPFFGEGNGMKTLCQFYKHVDLRSQFLDGFTFDASTSIWWKEKDSKAKQELLSDDDTTPLLSIEGVMEHFFAWIKGLSEDLSADNIYLWAQGTDFDIAILRHICHRYNKQIPVRYTKFRDHRTFFLEGARLLSRRMPAVPSMPTCRNARKTPIWAVRCAIRGRPTDGVPRSITAAAAGTATSAMATSTTTASTTVLLFALSSLFPSSFNLFATRFLARRSTKMPLPAYAGQIIFAYVKYYY